MKKSIMMERFNIPYIVVIGIANVDSTFGALL